MGTTQKIMIDALQTPEDWERVRPMWDDLERISSCPPWSGHGFAELSWYNSGQPETYSIVLMKDESPVGGCFFWVEAQEYAGRAIRTLRLFDDIFFMYMPFLVAPAEGLGEAVRMFFSNASAIRKQTHTDMIYLRRIDEASYGFCQDCSSVFRPMHGEVFTRAPQLSIPKDQVGEEALKSLQPKRLKKLRHQQVRMKKLLGSGTEIKEYALHELVREGDTQTLDAVLDDFFALRARSWQHEWEEESPKVNHALLIPFMRKSIALWAENYQVSIFFVMHEGNPIAFFLAALWDDRCWGVITGYDKEFHKFSVGQQAFLDGVIKLHDEEGLELFELGGEVIGWKEKWKTAEIPVHTAFCSLSPLALTANAVIWKRKLSKPE